MWNINSVEREKETLEDRWQAEVLLLDREGTYLPLSSKEAG